MYVASVKPYTVSLFGVFPLHWGYVAHGTNLNAFFGHANREKMVQNTKKIQKMQNSVDPHIALCVSGYFGYNTHPDKFSQLYHQNCPFYRVNIAIFFWVTARLGAEKVQYACSQCETIHSQSS